MKRILILLLMASFLGLTGQETNETKRPKAIVGIVVDQMRQDYLARFWTEFGEGGFKRLVSEGANCTLVFYDYKPTYTGPGHASIFTGAGPDLHGIVGNSWYQREDSSNVYCAAYPNESGEMIYSPLRMQCDGIADQVKANSRAKVFGVSLKDRGAILPAGKKADAAFWFSGKTGEWMSSEYYPKNSPSWLTDWNRQDLEQRYLSVDWEYSGSDTSQFILPDANPYEGFLSPGTGNSFPYNLKLAFEESSFSLLKRIPQGNQMTADFAMELSQKEGIGKDRVMDFLSISFSATDYVGHRYGVESREVKDTYLQLDKTLAELIQFFDAEYGAGEYLLFLTSDHGAAENPQYLKDRGKAAGYFSSDSLESSIERRFSSVYGEGNWVLSLSNLNVYFNSELIRKYQVNPAELKREVLRSLEGTEAIQQVIVPEQAKETISQIEETVNRGFYRGRSGDLVLYEARNWLDYPATGTSHGSPYTYDTHVPLIFFGTGVKPMEVDLPYSVRSIAATVSELAGMQAPACSSSESILEILK